MQLIFNQWLDGLFKTIHQKLVFTKPVIFLSVMACCILVATKTFSQESRQQSIKNVLLTLNVKNETLAGVLEQIELVTDFRFVYNNADVNTAGSYSFSKKNVSLFQILQDVLPATLVFEQVGTNILITKQLPVMEEKVNNLTISGQVKDEAGMPIPGVSVTLINSNRGVVTNNAGEFRIQINAKTDSLYLSSVSHLPEVVPVNHSTVLLIYLKLKEGQTLSDVVVLGYGTSKRRNVSTAISQLTGEQLGERPTSINVVQAIAGKVPGVNVMTNSGRPGGKPTIKIRGMGSLNASNAPLYVIDGFVGADPAIIDPNIISSVSILKDAAAAAIYGSRGSNGVIIITTIKSGKQKASIALNSSISFGTLARTVDLLDAEGALEMIKRQYEFKAGRIPPHLDPSYPFQRKTELFNLDGTPKYNVNWQKEATRTAISTNNSLTFSGGKDNSNIIANLSYKKQEGIMINNYAKQVNGYVNAGWDVKDWFHLQAALNAGGIQQNNIDLNTLGLNPLREMMEFLPFLPVKYEDGTYSRKGDYPGAENSENPVKLLNEVKSITGRVYSLGNIIGTIKLSPHLQFTSSLGGLLNSGYNFYYAGRNVYDYSQSQQGIARRSHTIGAAWTNEDYFTYRNQFNGHRVDLVAGASWYYYLSTSTAAGAQSFLDDYYSYNSLQAGSVWEQPTSGTDRNQLNSYYTRANYSYDNKYLLGLSYRADASSRFGANNKFGYFPSFSFAWIISEASFFKRLRNTVDHLKIRTSYGTNGNAAIGNYITLDRLNTSQVVFNNQLTPAVTVGELGNKNLKWEKATQFNLGLDMGLFDGTINFTVDVYNKITSDLLYRKHLPSTTGYSGVYDNIGSIQNRGLEVGLTAAILKQSAVTWNSSMNFSMNRSKVRHLNGDIIYTWGGRIMEGRPLNEFFGYRREKVWRTHEAEAAAVYGKQPGDLRWTDVNNNKMTDAGDRIALGSGMPSFETNMDNMITWKAFTLFFDVQVMYGHKILNFSRNIDENQAPWTNSYRNILNAWTSGNQETYLARLRLPVDGNENPVDSYNIEDGSFLRLRNVSISYDLNSVFKRFGLQRFRLSLIAENYLLITRYKGYDPENTSFDGELNQGVDFFQYPKPKTISLKISVDL